MQKHYGEIQALGGQALVVSFSRPDVLQTFLASEPLAFPVVADPSLAAYRAFGLQRTSWAAILRGGTILRYSRLIFRGWLPRRANEGEDVLQLGGDFVLDGAGSLVYAYRSNDPTDRPAVEELLEAVRTAQRHP